MARILILDDDPDITFAVSLILARQGYDVRTAATRGEGMQALIDFRPDLLILDVMLEQPDDGIAMAQELRRNGNAVPIIMLSSVGRVTGMDFDRDEEMLPVDAFLAKPARPDELLAKVGELLAREGASPCS